MQWIVVSALMLAAAAPQEPAQEKQFEVNLTLVGSRDGAILAAPRVSMSENQTARVNIVSEHSGAALRGMLTTPSTLPPQVATIGENPQTGIAFAVKVEGLDGKRVLLHLDVQFNEVQKATKYDTQIVGSTLRAVKQVELGKTVKFVLSSDSKGRTQRFVWATVKQRLDGDAGQQASPLLGTPEPPKPIPELVPAPRADGR
ncbi:MAG TPA: hypothetical protein VKU02_08335 [Gemmataceae bacterium]|nr:hypothetical protein [Gemmataceae bacterium]